MFSAMVTLLAGVASQPAVARPIPPVPVITIPSPYTAPFPPLPEGAEPAVRAASNLPLPQLFSTNDYPVAALRHEEQGTVAFAVAIDPTGRVTACSITQSSGSANLDVATCSIIQRRARFTPAREASGGVVEDRSKGRVRWMLPAAPRPPAGTPPFGPGIERSGVHLPSLFSANDYPEEALLNEEEGTVSVRLSIGQDGVPTRCAVTISSGSASLDTTTCAILQGRGRFRPTRDASGRAVEHSMDGNIRWLLPQPEPLPVADPPRPIV